MSKNIVQGSPEWIAARVGKVTASRMADVVSKTKAGKYTAAREEYLAELVTEILTGKPVEFFQTKDMQWGIEQEPHARAAYEADRLIQVELIGIVDHPFIERAAASPDGLVEDDGLIEIKCPKTKTHIQTLMCGAPPEQYLPQMQWQMACTGRIWCDFVSFDPRLPKKYQLFTQRVFRDQQVINQYEDEVRRLLQEVDSIINQLESR
jgi:putative phage-type endonuclease